MTTTSTDRMSDRATRPTTAPAQGGGRDGPGWVRPVIWLQGLVVALGAAVATAHGLFEVAVAARVPVAIAWLYPLITDGLALVAYTATARLHRGAARYAWSVVVLAAGLSGLAQASYLASNTAAAGGALDAPAALRFGVGAWPAVAAAVVAHLLYLLTNASSTTTTSATEPAAKATIPATPSVDVPFDSAQGPGPRSDREAPATATPGDHDRPVLGVAEPVQHPVHPTVQPTPQPAPAVQPVLYDALTAELAASAPTDSARPAPPVLNTPVEHPRSPVEHFTDTSEHAGDRAPDPAPRDRARAAAQQHADHHGALPTVSELEALAAVSRGTAAAALKALRARPAPLRLVPDSTAPVAETPDPETQT